MKNLKVQLALLGLSTLCLLTTASGQLTPSGDAYTSTAAPTKNYGAATLLDVDSASQTTYIQFNLSSIPAGYTGAAITQATLKLYVNAVTTAGSFNVDYVNGTWSESTIDASNAPALGNTIAASVPLDIASKNQYILINITPAVQAWLSGIEPNDGVALVANSPLNASFDSKENTTTSHPAELDIVFAGGGGTITGITTAEGSGLIGGGTSGTLNLSLLNTCGSGQVLEWSESAWACATPGGSTALSSITPPTADTRIATGTFPTTFTEGDFGSSPVSSAFGITDTATSTTDDSFDLTVENGNNSYHNPFSTGVKEGGIYFPQLQICNNGSGHVGASLFGNAVTCGTLSKAPYNKVTITDNTGSHTGLAILNNSFANSGASETGTMLRLLSATATSGSYNFLTACAGTTAADGLCNGTIVATLTAPGALSVAASVTAPEFCIGSSCITSWPNGAAITGVTTASGSGLVGGSFKIDHPLDPANKYLSHSFVESPDMMNIYNGVATLDARGSVWITLPEYFEALNQDFRYQLTSIGRPQPSLYVAREISGNRFKISGGKPGGRVSWQVTGIRHDAYADAHRIQVEVEKPPQEQGRYLHPELFGAPAEQAIGYHATPTKPLEQAECVRLSSLKRPRAPLK
jgi:hypothetical protein